MGLNKMNIKQKLLGMGLAAILNSGCNDELAHFSYLGRITAINRSYAGQIIIELENSRTGSTATAYIRESAVNDIEKLNDRLELGRKLPLQDCFAVPRERNNHDHYKLAECTIIPIYK